MIKKFLLVSLLVLVLSGNAFASHVIGAFTPLKLDPEELLQIASNDEAGGITTILGSQEPFIIKHYDSLPVMIMALQKGEIDEVRCPDKIGMFITKIHPELEIKCAILGADGAFSFAFKEDNKALRDEFNEALKKLRSDMVLERLEDEYYQDFEMKKPATEFEKFEGADTIKVAVTGDQPPIDLITPDGKATGYNTAVLSEIGKLLKKNIELVLIDSGARIAALSSGRADVVFWATVVGNRPSDIPDSLIVSDPYFKWHNYVHVGLKSK